MDSPLSPVAFSDAEDYVFGSPARVLTTHSCPDVCSSEADSGSETEEEPLPPASTQDSKHMEYISVFALGVPFAMEVHGQMALFRSCQCALNAAMTQYLQGGPRVDMALRFTAKGSAGTGSARQQLKAFRRACAAEGVHLNKDAWAEARQEVMQRAIRSRCLVDHRFRLAIRSIVRRGVRIPMRVRYGRLLKQAGLVLQ